MSGWTLVPEPSAAAKGWTPVPESPPEPPPAKGGWEGVKRGLSSFAHLPGAVLEALTKPPQNEEEEQVHTLGQYMPLGGSAGALAIHRLVAVPMAQQRELAKQYQKQATGSEEMPPERMGFDFSLTGSTPQEKAQHLANLHNIASVVPMVGPMVADMTERFLGIGGHEGNPDKSGALAEGATYLAAPEVAKGVLKGAGAAGKAMPEAVKNYTPSGNIPELLKRTALGQTVGRLPASSMVEQLTGSKALVRPTLKDWWQALQPDKQMSLFKSMPKLGDTPISPETHPATLNFLQEQASPSATKPFQAGGSTVPRVSSGEAVINDALTSLDKPTLMRIANSRGINTTTEANLIPSKAEASLVKKIKADMTFDELNDARDVGLEATRNKPVPGQDLGKKAMQEAWHYKVVKQFFPDVDLPAAMEKRAQATIAKRPTSADYTPIYRAAAQKASPAGATDAEIKAKAVDLQAQDENMEALLRESIAQAQGKTAPGASQPADIVAKAKTEFGTTEDFREAGFILKDGDMLDFSGKREGGQGGVRYMDHRDIQRVVDSSGSQALADFEKGSGALRFSYVNGDVNVSLLKGQRPTLLQMSKVQQALSRGRGGLYVDGYDKTGMSHVIYSKGVENATPRDFTKIVEEFYGQEEKPPSVSGGSGGKTEQTATAEGRGAQAEAARAGAKYMNPSPKGKGTAQTPIEETEEGARMIRERAARDAARKGTLGEMR